MSAFLDTLVRAEDLPGRRCEPSEVEPTTDAIPASTRKLFLSFQKQIFGTDNLISLKACLDCDAFSDYAARTIHVQPAKIRQIIDHYGRSSGLTIIKFILAHELSHFVQEASVGAGRSANLSLNGLESLFVFAEGQENSAGAGHLAHAEVDAYALLILRQARVVRPTILLDFFEDELREIKKAAGPDTKVVVDDIELRRKQIQTVLDHLWPN